MLKIGVVGAGTVGETHLMVFKDMESSGKIQLACLAEPQQERREKFEKQYNIPGYADHRKMLEEEQLDGVTVATPDHLHFAVVNDILDQSISCLVEKPLDVTVPGSQALAQKAAEKGVLLEVDFHKRFDPYHIEMRESYLEGKFGDVEYGYAWMEDQLWVPQKMLRAWSEHSSPVWFLGVHMVDLVRWIMDNPDPVSVYATGSRSKLKSVGIDTWDAVQAHVSFNNGAHITFNNCWILPDAFEAVVHQGVKLVGTEGIFECDSQYRGGRGCLKGESMKTWNLGIKHRQRDKHNNTIWRGYFHASIADFAENLIFLDEGGTLEQLQGLYPSAQEGAVITQIACAVHESLESKEVISL